MADRRSVARRARGALRRARLLRPRLGVVVLPTPADQAGLDATLHRLRAIADPGLEIVVPLAGVEDPSREAALRHAAEDWRVRTIDDEVTDAAGIAAALGSRYVVVLHGGEEIDRRLLESVESLDASERAWAVGPAIRTAATGCAIWPRAMLADLGAEAAVESLPAVALAADPEPLVLRRPLSRPRPEPPVRGLRDMRAALTGAVAAGRDDLAAVPEEWRARWAASTLAGLGPFLDDAERYDGGSWDLLRRWAELLVEAAGEELAAVPVETRVKAWLAAHGRRDDLIGLIAARRFEAGQLATRAADGVVSAVLPVDVPESLLALAESETALRLSGRRLWLDGDDLRLRLFAYISGVDLSAEEPEVTVALVDEGGARLEVPVTVSADREVTRFAGTRHVSHDHGVVDLAVPVAALADGSRWRVEVTVRVAGLERTGLVRHQDRGGSIGAFRPVVLGARVLRVVPGDFALVVEQGGPSPRPAGPVLTDVRLDAETLTVSTSDPGDLRLDGPARLDARRAQDAVTWTLRHAPWGLGERPAPTGRYALARVDGGPIALARTLAARLPETVLTEHHRAVISVEEHSGGHQLVVELGPPLADDEIGPYCQRRLQEWYADPARERHDDLVYLQAYTGASATDSPRAIADELARVRPELRQVWAVADAGSYVPDGAETVLWRSREWYAALAGAGHIVTNIELEAWFRRRPDQRVLQTFHGYPSKAMGLGLWLSKGFSPSRIEQQLDRTSRNWTLLLTPSPEMDVHYRENYRYDGEILAAGYPRDDVLVDADGAAKGAARVRLGIDSGLDRDSTVVLYAPTWRDDQAVAARRAPMVDHLDIAATAADLGPAYTLLLRGHRFMTAPRVEASGARVIDVTGHPEINDLILAADAVVLDYSSMRFDVALTGIPMIFLVPDLERYSGDGRGFLFPFEPTAPGPLLRDRDEVVAALRDLDGVRSRYAAAREEFNRAYNAHQDGRSARRTVERFFPSPAG